MEYEYRCGHYRVMGQCGDHVRCQDTRHCHEAAGGGDTGVTAVGEFLLTTDNGTHHHNIQKGPETSSQTTNDKD